MERTYKTIAILIIILGLGYLAVDSMVVATVNGMAITRFELMHELEKIGGNQTLENLTQRKLIEKEIESYNIEVTDEEINEQVEALRVQFESVPGNTLESILEMQGLTLESFKSQVALQVKLRKIVEQELELTEVEDSDEKDAQISLGMDQWIQRVQDEGDIRILKEF